jgi:DNA-damage-inducible protein D
LTLAFHLPAKPAPHPLIVHSLWSDEDEKWYFSIIDIISILTDQPTHQGARNYWKVLKNRLVKEGNETVTNCNRLKLLANNLCYRAIVP